MAQPHPQPSVPIQPVRTFSQSQLPAMPAQPVPSANAGGQSLASPALPNVAPPAKRPSPSPAASGLPFPNPAPPPKRPRLSPTPNSMAPSIPSPIPTSMPPQQSQHYSAPPSANTTPLPLTPSQQPHHPTLPPGSLANHHQPYTNGAMSPAMNYTPQPSIQPHPSPAVPSPLTPNQHGSPSPASANSGYYSQQHFAPPPGTVAGTMGPPSKPAEKPVKEVQYDVDDPLAGTGIDLAEEEKFQASFFGGSFGADARTGFPSHPHGDKDSFYGAGPANQPAQSVSAESQAAFAAEEAARVWTNARIQAATVRANEIKAPFLQIPSLGARMEKVAKEYGLGLNLDPKANPGTAGRMRLEVDKPRVTVRTELGPDGALVSTAGIFLPEDCYLADQVALMSLAAKHRLRELLEDANQVAVMRQKTSHGEIPEEWLDAAVPQGADNETGPNSQGKRDANPIARSLREAANSERSSEEMRLRRRQKREEAKKDPTGASRAASAAPGTPGGVAPEPEKLTKKEKRSRDVALKAAEASSTRNANETMAMMFGKKKKQYSWMSGGNKSGTSTPNKFGSTPAAAGAPATPATPAEPVKLTPDGRTRFGQWREDGKHGKDIQLRDWVAVLQHDGREKAALQFLYTQLDGRFERVVQ